MGVEQSRAPRMQSGDWQTCVAVLCASPGFGADVLGGGATDRLFYALTHTHTQSTVFNRYYYLLCNRLYVYVLFLAAAAAFRFAVVAAPIASRAIIALQVVQ